MGVEDRRAVVLRQDSADQRRAVAQRRGRPWLRLQAGVSLDGRTALSNGVSQWINGDESRADSHAWRQRADAVLTGIGTVLADDPRLDVRLVATTRQPRRVVVDSRLSTPPDANLFSAPGAVLIYTAQMDRGRARALRSRGAAIGVQAGADGQVDLLGVLTDLAAQGVLEVHVEAGATLNGALLRAGLVDELLVYLAPKLLGAGPGLAAIGPFARLEEGPALAIHSCRRIGSDVRLVVRPI